MKDYSTIQEYMKGVAPEFLPKVKEMRALINSLIPKGEEVIRYGMPTIQLHGKNFVHFAAMKGHLGFYPAPSGVVSYADELTKRNISFSKGCIRFSYHEPLPVSLIKKIIAYRLKEEKSKQ